MPIRRRSLLVVTVSLALAAAPRRASCQPPPPSAGERTATLNSVVLTPTCTNVQQIAIAALSAGRVLVSAAVQVELSHIQGAAISRGLRPRASGTPSRSRPRATTRST